MDACAPRRTELKNWISTSMPDLWKAETCPLTSEHVPRISPILNSMNFLLGCWLDLYLLALLAHKYDPS